ncbi:hypothetical protein B0H19DRAFT_1138829 [Mycena capillaripes]|nr:hypothetical protein B0H19DRAFT_1138829 [Mycena capillaripes]
MACWDTDSAECVGTFDHEAEPVGIDAMSPVEIYPLLRPESCSIGMVYSSLSTDAFELAIICFDHRNPAAVEGSKVFSKIWTTPEPEEYRVSEVVVNEDTFAAILVKYVADLSFLLICGREDAVIRIIPLGSNEHATLPRCIIIKDDFYVTQQYFDPIADIIHVQTSATRTESLDLPIHKTTIPVPSSTASPMMGTSLGFCNLRLPTYGVLNITLKAAYADDDEPELFLNSLHFWPAEHDGSRLTVGSLCFYEHPCDIESVAVGSSATCGIIVDEHKALGLVQYLPDSTTHVQFTPLYIPHLDVLQYEAKWHMLLDDRLGAFYLGRPVPENGRYHLSVVSYA